MKLIKYIFAGLLIALFAAGMVACTDNEKPEENRSVLTSAIVSSSPSDSDGTDSGNKPIELPILP